jgi:hypothetical protein
MYDSAEISSNRVNGEVRFGEGYGGGVMLWFDGSIFRLYHGSITGNTAQDGNNAGTQFYWYFSGQQPYSILYIGENTYSGTTGPINVPLTN